MTAEQRTTAEQRQALRDRYTRQHQRPVCPKCGLHMDIKSGDDYWTEWQCPDDCHHRTLAKTRNGDLDALAAVDDADALAAALAEVERLRGALFAITKAEDLDEAVMVARAALAPTDATSDRTPEGAPS